MSDTKLTHVDESGNADELLSLNINDLRKYAKMMGVAAQRDWGATEFVTAIKAKMAAAKFSSDTQGGDQLAPGQARIIIFRDPTPNHANSPVQLVLNGRLLNVPRGVEVTVPLEYVGVLNDAKGSYTRQKVGPSLNQPEGVTVEETIPSYPFQVLAIRPHENGSSFASPFDTRAAIYRRRLAFLEAIGKWPTIGELLQFEKDQKELQSFERRMALGANK